MQKSYLLLMILLIFNCSCEDDISHETNEELIDSYYYGYMHYPLGIMPTSGVESLVIIEYDDDDKIMNRIGGISQISPATGFSGIFNNNIYDELAYNGNEILIERKITTQDFYFPVFKRTIKYDQQNKITQKIIETTYPVTLDTIDYIYNSVGKLIRTSSRSIQWPKEAYFYYNTNNNLDSIVTNNYTYLSSFPEPFLIEKIVEIFGVYDNSSNPLKKLILFEELFYRSLCENNYSFYQKKEFSWNNSLTYEEERNWTFFYDDDGRVKFDVY